MEQPAIWEKIPTIANTRSFEIDHSISQYTGGILKVNCVFAI